MPQLVYMTREIKAMFDVSERTLRRWVKEGRFPAPILPGRWDCEQIARWRTDISGQKRTSGDTRLKNNRHEEIRL